MRAKGDPLAPEAAQNVEMEITVGGRYTDRLEKRGGVWKIINRAGTTDWRRVLPATDQLA